jgi:hypothetical protein
MRDLFFYDPFAQCGTSAPKGSNLSEALPKHTMPYRGNTSRKWRQGPKRRLNAKNLVVQDLQRLASERASAVLSDGHRGGTE